MALWMQYKQELAKLFENSKYSEVQAQIKIEFNLLVKEFKVKAQIKIPKIVSDHLADFGVKELGTLNAYKIPIYNPLDKPLHIKILLGNDEKLIEKQLQSRMEQISEGITAEGFWSN